MFLFIKRSKSGLESGALAYTSQEAKPMTNRKNKKEKQLDKTIDFAKQHFTAVLRSRTGSLTELATLLRFQQGTKGYQRRYDKLVSLIKNLKEAFKQTLLKAMPNIGFRLGIIDDTTVKKSGKKFPKQQKHKDSSTGNYYNGMKVVSTSLYQAGKSATVSSKIVGKGDNKLYVAIDEISTLAVDFLVDIFLFDNWYCKKPVLDEVRKYKKTFISRLRKDGVSITKKFEKRIDKIAAKLQHKQYDQIKIHGKSYWIYEITLEFKTYGKLRVIISKEGVNEKPIFICTNNENFSPKFIVKLYLCRFNIEVFFKDAKQYLNFEKFFCRLAEKWELHLHLTNILHWCIQKKKSISKTVRNIRENINACSLFINKNQLLANFIDELRKLCPT